MGATVTGLRCGREISEIQLAFSHCHLEDSPNVVSQCETGIGPVYVVTLD